MICAEWYKVLLAIIVPMLWAYAWGFKWGRERR